MLFRMIRTQTGERATYRSGVAYDSGKDAKVIAEAKGFIKSGFAEEVTEAQLKKEKAVAEKLSVASVEPAKPGAERAALRAAQKAAADAQAEADKANDALAASLKEIEDLKAQIAELNASAESKNEQSQA